jgi:hypothetical protein
MKSDSSFMGELFRIVNSTSSRHRQSAKLHGIPYRKAGKTGDVSSAKRLCKMLEESDQQLRPAVATFAKAQIWATFELYLNDLARAKRIP